MTSSLIGRDVELGSTTIRLYELDPPGASAGTGRPVLWLHGAGAGNGGAVAWASTLPRIPGFRHLAPDVPGFGHSNLPEPMPRGLAAITKARVAGIVELLDMLGLDTVDVVAHSMGGLFGLSLLCDHADRVGRAVLVASGGAPVKPGPLLKTMITWYQNPTREAMADWIRESMAGPAEDLDDTSTQSAESGLGPELEALLDERMTQAMLPGVREAHEATFAREGEPVVYDASTLERIDREVLVVQGADDRVIPPGSGKHFATHIAGARMLSIPRCGHWPHVEHPDRFGSAIGSFLNGLA